MSMHFGINRWFRIAETATLMGILFSGCASTPKPVEAPVSQPEPVPVEAVTEPAPEMPKEADISPDLKALRESIAQKRTEDIQKNAHDIIDRNAAADEKAEALRALAECALEAKNTAEARLYAENANSTQPDSLETLLLLAKVAYASDAQDEAIRHLKRATETSPNDHRAYAMNAAILLGFLDTERALEAATKAHELAPKDCVTSIIYADALNACHQFETAIAQYEFADNAQCAMSEQAMKNMAKIYEVHVQSPAKACSMYQRLLNNAPDNAYYKASRDYQCSQSGE